MMKVYAVFDTNVLVSALISRQADTAVVHAVEALLCNEMYEIAA